eukprot:Nitzschia sp. Nitz4//scaffold186_size43309//5543//5875//NITZ4_007315-RA/size43309-processed-gene-0.35-mRNA-1//-1//CDS//3329539752//1142//frame0
MSSIESMITRELDVRFIDAHVIVNEAKISLGLEGYPKQQDIERIHAESVRLFFTKTKDERESLRRMHWDLESVKSEGSHISDTESTLSSHIDSEHGVGGFRRFFHHHRDA